jgi:bacteriophage exclusion system BrxC/D-like protein
MSARGPIRPKERDAILQSLAAGVVPRIGQRHIQVGRLAEVRALVRDLECVADGGATLRFVVGDYGSGKTFFLYLIRSIALEKRLVAAHADLTPERRLQATSGQARTLYAELMRTLSTRSTPDGGALPGVLERFITSALQAAEDRRVSPETVIHERLAPLQDLLGGYDFATVIATYWQGHDRGNDPLKADAIRWLRGEFPTKAEARAALGVRTVVDDSTVYDQLKLMGRFVRLAGYAGLLICLDELDTLSTLSNTTARHANYAQILRILNDSLQGGAVGLGWLLGGTPECLLDPRRGLSSHDALQSRLAENPFAVDGRVDVSGPVLRLANLTAEDLFVLLRNIRHVFAGGDPAKYLLPDTALQRFMTHCSQGLGDAYFRTPRQTIKQFVHLLSILDQHPHMSWRDLIGTVPLAPDPTPDRTPRPTAAKDTLPPSAAQTIPSDPGDALATFILK